MAQPSSVTGTYTGTGAAVNIPLGFYPSLFVAANETDGDELFHAFRKPDGTYATIETAAAAATEANGVTRYTGAAGSAAVGVTVGTGMSENAKVYQYVAFR
jgi:hypothetical protein